MVEPLLRSTTKIPSASALRMVRSAPTSRLLSRILSGLLVVFVLVLAFAPWVQNARGAGRVIAYAPEERQQTIEAPVDGRVSRWYVQEGAVVAQGDPIVDIVDNDPMLLARLTDERSAVAARLTAAQTRQRSVRKRIDALTMSRDSAIGAARSRVKMASERKVAAKRGITAAEAAEKANQRNAERQAALASRGLSSERTREVADADLTRAETEVDRAQASARAAESDELAAQADALKVEADATASVEDAQAQLAVAQAEEASAAAELARIDVRLARQSAQAVVAPRAGVVLRLLANRATEQVKAGDPIAIIVPSTDARAVELWVDGNDVPLVTVGRPVRLQFEGWPAVQFSGWPSVAVGTFGGRVALVDATDDGKGKFRVLVVPTEPWPSGAFLRQGVRANGWVLMETVPLGWELWRQFNGFPPTLSQRPELHDIPIDPGAK